MVVSFRVGTSTMSTTCRPEESTGISLRATGVDLDKSAKYISTHPERSETGVPVTLGARPKT